MSFPYRTVKPEPFDVFTLAQARRWLNMDIEGVTFADDEIKDLVEEAISLVETRINISLGVSTYEWYPECRPCDIPDTFYIKQILSISQDVEGVDTVVSPVNYSLIRTGRRLVKIVWNKDYERSSGQYKMTFTAGFLPSEIPKELKTAIRLLLSALYNSEGDPVSEKKTLSDKLINLHVIGYA